VVKAVFFSPDAGFTTLPPFPPFFGPVTKNVARIGCVAGLALRPTVFPVGPEKAGEGGEGGVFQFPPGTAFPPFPPFFGPVMKNV
jgi:hypothetical protein